MNWEKLNVKDLNKFRYPNLIAEIIGSQYSICTLSEHMGYGRCEENDIEIRSKVFTDKLGDGDITFAEAAALSRLFNCEMEYLFSSKVKLLDGEAYAYIRWSLRDIESLKYDIDRNRERVRELKERIDRDRKKLGELESQVLRHSTELCSA